MLNDLTKEEIAELNDLLEQLKQIEQLSEKSRKEKIMGEIVATLFFCQLEPKQKGHPLDVLFVLEKL